MRVLLLTASFPPITGGAETYARLLAEGLVTQGHEVTVVTDGFRLPETAVVSVENGVRVIRLRRFASEVDVPGKLPWRQMQCAALAELSEAFGHPDDAVFDVVHANSHETLVWAAMIALQQGAVLAASLHEQNPQLEPFGEGRCLLSYRALPVDVYFAGSEFYAERATAYGVPAERLRLVHHGVPVVAPEPGAGRRLRAELGVGAGERLIVCPARVYERKAQHDLIRALPAVLAACPSARLLLAGRTSDPGYEKRMWELARELDVVAPVIRRTDLLTEDMPAVFDAADLVVQPSLEEGLGLAAVEAMAAAVPVVATGVPGLREVVTDRHDGLVVPASSPDRLAAAIVELLSDDALGRRLTANALRTVAERFSQERMVNATLGGYAQARTGRRGAVLARGCP